MNFVGKSIISINDMNKEELDYILVKSKEVKEGKWKNTLSGKIIATLFFEPSTRTRLSFETAILKQNGQIIGFASSDVSSTKKGESLSDSIKNISRYVDAIVMRHPVEGAARRAAEVSNKPIINGGDGANQHPTQTLLDLFTINEVKGHLNNLKIGLMGDLKFGRTIHSLLMALSFYNCEIHFISPELLRVPDYYYDFLKKKNVNFYIHEDFREISKDLDILYCTRIQKERFSDPIEYLKVAGSYKISKEDLKYLGESTYLMHPLPRVDEISPEVDNDRRAIYFDQAENGVYVREALLGLVLGTIK
ncbi:MAG: aspartate carbamoyltransferase [Spirochaetes bacterium]|nr:aspartate carbamoyltransferase [Spirochaetota bacterium]